MSTLPRGRGRPRVDASDTSITISVTLPEREYDRLSRRAREARASLQDVIRARLKTAAAPEKISKK
jgi:hypothetical protein